MFSQLKRLPLPSWPVVLYWVVLLGALYAFVELAQDVYEQEGFPFDQALLTWLYVHQSPLWTRLALTLSFIGSIFVLGPLALALVSGLWRQSRRAAVFLALGLGGAVALNYGFKLLLARTRPELFAQLSPETSFSFPSGHAMGSSAFFLALFLIVRRLYPGRQVLSAGLGLHLTLGISLSRPYLQVHYPSDIVAGWALSSAWVLGVNLWYAGSTG